ncbi:MAG: hypothetical protein OEX19_09005, partial [Gammaproteobacteria bacterium]|nr:hypothetical protein [Gammaproteobacteria bacterium]
MDRRDFLRFSASATLFTAAPRAFARMDNSSTDWRTYELVYKIDLSRTQGAGTLWLPVPQNAGDYQRVLSIDLQGNATAALQSDPIYRAPVVIAKWDIADRDRELTVVS